MVKRFYYLFSDKYYNYCINILLLAQNERERKGKLHQQQFGDKTHARARSVQRGDWADARAGCSAAPACARASSRLYLSICIRANKFVYGIYLYTCVFICGGRSHAEKSISSTRPRTCLQHTQRETDRRHVCVWDHWHSNYCYYYLLLCTLGYPFNRQTRYNDHCHQKSETKKKRSPVHESPSLSSCEQQARTFVYIYMYTLYIHTPTYTEKRTQSIFLWPSACSRGRSTNPSSLSHTHVHKHTNTHTCCNTFGSPKSRRISFSPLTHLAAYITARLSYRPSRRWLAPIFPAPTARRLCCCCCCSVAAIEDWRRSTTGVLGCIVVGFPLHRRLNELRLTERTSWVIKDRVWFARLCVRICEIPQRGKKNNTAVFLAMERSRYTYNTNNVKGSTRSLKSPHSPRLYCLYPLYTPLRLQSMARVSTYTRALAMHTLCQCPPLQQTLLYHYILLQPAIAGLHVRIGLYMTATLSLARRDYIDSWLCALARLAARTVYVDVCIMHI